MTPRNTKHGASANGRRTSSQGKRRATASTRSHSGSAKKGQPAGGSTRSRAASSRTSTRSPSSRSSTQKREARPAITPWRWWLFPAATFALVIAFAWGYYPVAKVQYRETRERARLAAELESLQARNDRLRKQVDRLKTPAGVEDYARSQLGMVKKGEKVLVVVDGDEKAEASAAVAPPVIDSDETTTAPTGTWTAFLDLVFGLR